MNNRSAILHSLINLDRPIEAIMDELRHLSWDVETPVIRLDISNVTSILQRYLSGTIDVSSVESWANAIEGRDDIAINGDRLRGIIHELANPILTRQLNPDVATSIISTLTHS